MVARWAGRRLRTAATIGEPGGGRQHGQCTGEDGGNHVSTGQAGRYTLTESTRGKHVRAERGVTQDVVQSLEGEGSAAEMCLLLGAVTPGALSVSLCHQPPADHQQPEPRHRPEQLPPQRPVHPATALLRHQPATNPASTRSQP